VALSFRKPCYRRQLAQESFLLSTLLFRYPQIADWPTGPIWVANHSFGFGMPAFPAFEAEALEPTRLQFNPNSDHPRLATRAPRPMNRQQFRVGLSRGRHNSRRLAPPRNVCLFGLRPKQER
jgi:hypothetical protein